MKTLAEHLAEQGLGSDHIWTTGRRTPSRQPADRQDAIATARSAIKRHRKARAAAAELEAQAHATAAQERTAAEREREAAAQEHEAAEDAPTRREARHHDEAAERHEAAAAGHEAAAERFEREAVRVARGDPGAVQRDDRRRCLETAAAEAVAAGQERNAANRETGIANSLRMQSPQGADESHPRMARARRHGEAAERHEAAAAEHEAAAERLRHEAGAMEVDFPGASAQHARRAVLALAKAWIGDLWAELVDLQRDDRVANHTDSKALERRYDDADDS